jgi:class 3 adenylate cyclase/tetratricopeptide (TPR) repeat protein
LVANGTHRKVVTVLFCDVVGSTALGESVDPEALQGLLARYFERMKGIVEAHGGSVEKFIGDAVMAVFGVPVAHEDDALRACRAATEMRDALPELGVEGRIGVNTGEVLANTGERLATGDAVNVAARLEQAAQPGEVLMGVETHGLVGAAVEVGEERWLELKGKRQPTAAYPLIAVHELAERSHASPFVGRERELEQLADAWDRALAASGCELVTVVGDAGVGKSRLVAEALAKIEARIVRGRCLSYGEGITYWPVVEVLKQLDAVPSEESAAEVVRSLLRETDTVAGTDEIAWAFRKLLEEQAPLVVCFDDIQWGEETFLDLIESTALLSSGAPLLLVCMARPELLDRRPRWLAPLRLNPLPEEEARTLVGDSVPDEVRGRIVRASGGNPLFLTEMVALRDEGDSEVEVPPTLRALLAARLDQLDETERRVLECGAVEGELFHRGPIQALTPEETEVTPRLAALVRRELVHPDRPQLPREEAYRFRHLLIRDAAYDALPKATRADLHRRFADWLLDHGRDLVELDEMLGYHLEQAYLYGVELGAPQEELARRACERLASAGRRAHLRGDLNATINLLERSCGLLSPEQQDIQLETDLSDALFSGGFPVEAEELLRNAADRAASRGDTRGALLARLGQTAVLLYTDPEGQVTQALALANEAIPLFEAAGDERGLIRAWIAIGWVEHNFCRWAARNAAFEKALAHANRARDERLALWLTSQIGAGYLWGPEPAEEGLQWYESRPEAVRTRPDRLAVLEAMRGRFDEARELLAEAQARTEELGQGLELGRQGETAWFVEIRGGDPVAAEAALRKACQLLEQMGERSALSTQAGELGHVLCALNRHDEAEQWARKSRNLGGGDDILTQMLWRQVLAKVQARRGELEEATRLAREAVELGEKTDMLIAIGLAHLDLAEVLEQAGRSDEAGQEVKKALELFGRKGDLPMAEQARMHLKELQGSATPMQ